MPDRWTPVVQKAQQQDSAALLDLLNEFENLIHHAVKRYHVPPQDRADLLQESYIGFLKAVYTFDPALGKPFAALAKARTRAAVWHSVRVKKRMLTHEAGTGEEDGQDSVFDLIPHPQAEEEFSELEWRQLLVSLSDREALVVESLVIDGLSLSDLARLEGVHRDTVATWKRRAFAKIKTELRRSNKTKPALRPSRA